MQSTTSTTTSLSSPIDDVIAKFEFFRVRPRWLFVRIESNNGHVGWGEATLEGHIEAVEGALEALKQTFMNWPTDNIEDIWQHGYRSRFYRGGEVLMSAISGLDIALWDLKGRRLGVPVWSLLGGKVREKIQVYSWIGGDSPKDILDAAKARQDAGYKAVKMNATGALGWLDSPAALDAAVDHLRIVKALGLDAGLDFHGRVHKPMAKQLAALLEPHRPLFIEEPLLHGHVAEIALLSKQTSIPIALGERLYTRQDFRPYLEQGAVDIVQPDVSHAGGISETRRIASLAETYDVGFAPHCPNGPIALAASFAMDANAPNFVIQESSIGIHYNEGADLLTYVKNPEMFDVTDGMVSVPHGPGIGVEINEELVRKAATDAPAWRNPVWRGPDGAFREW
ncbi:enolase C-terminal domain-like protein [Ramaria rubella]|nr:enolase C-terminal domain-like protein [Ramaria rubella]